MYLIKKDSIMRALLLTVGFFALSTQAWGGKISGSIYRNYAEDQYQQEIPVAEQRKYYDLFGEHIIDGISLFEMSNSEENVYSSSLDDSSVSKISKEYQHNHFYSQLNSMCLSQDEIGKSKMLFMIGDRLHTKFTPLTLSKRNFSGLRWDLWSAGLKMTALLSRTRPGVMARSGIDGYAYVTYPLLDFDFNNIDNWYEENGVYSDGSARDWSQKTFFGDYDLLFAMHAENNLANLVDVGVTYINHHRSDIAKGEKFFQGELPDKFAPEEIHFEISDMTSDVLDDAGAEVLSITMLVNDKPVTAAPGIHRIVDYISVSNGQSYLQKDISDEVVSLPCTTHGTEGMVFTFYPIAGAALLGIDSAAIVSVNFVIEVAGNYRIFSSCEKLTPQDKDHFDTRKKILKQKTVETVASNISGVGGSLLDHRTRSEIYFGDYIAQAPYPVADYSNRRTINYAYMIPVSNVTYGINFNGKMGDFTYSGEYVTSKEEVKSPFIAGERQKITKYAGFVKLGYLLKDKYSFYSDMYNIDADYHSGLGSFYTSPFFNSMYDRGRNLGKEPKYFVYPHVLDNNYTLVDDNDDDDFYVENERRKYPGESYLPTGSISEYLFYNDGTVKSYADAQAGIVVIKKMLEKRIMLPNGLYRYYEDHNGVIPNRYDINTNGIIDAEEDFLLYNVTLPIFELEEDANNNGVYDIEEDDFAPDYPYAMGHVYVGNDIKTQGIRGISGGAKLQPLALLNVDVGGVYERVLDTDLDELENDLYDDQGSNRNLYLRAKFDQKLRNKGIAYKLGLETKRIWDGIKNDVIVTHQRLGSVRQEVDYTIKTDQLRYFDALTALFTGSIMYRKIANLNIESNIAIGIEKHNAVDNPLYVTRSLVRDPLDEVAVLPGMYQNTSYAESDVYQNASTFRTEYLQYEDKSARSLDFLYKTDYTVKFTKEYRGQYSRYFNILQQLQIIPQYQLHYINGSSDDDDPRDMLATMVADSTTDTLGMKFLWEDYTTYNKHMLFNVPILRAVFKIGERSTIEAGWQWMSAKNLLIEEETYLKSSFVTQLINRATIQGFDVAIILGLHRTNIKYDIYGKHALFGFGHDADVKTTSAFCKIYAGLKQQ